MSSETFSSYDKLKKQYPIINQSFRGYIYFSDQNGYYFLTIDGMSKCLFEEKTVKYKREHSEIVIEYYEDNRGNIIKYDKTNGDFYVLNADGTKWIESSSFISDYIEGELTRIDYDVELKKKSDEGGKKL
jgi:hypothetical protein